MAKSEPRKNWPKLQRDPYKFKKSPLELEPDVLTRVVKDCYPCYKRPFTAVDDTYWKDGVLYYSDGTRVTYDGTYWENNILYFLCGTYWGDIYLGDCPAPVSFGDIIWNGNEWTWSNNLPITYPLPPPGGVGKVGPDDDKSGPPGGVGGVGGVGPDDGGQSAFILPLPGETFCEWWGYSQTYHFAGTGGSGSLYVKTYIGCSWQAETNYSWISLTGSTHLSSGTVGFTVGENTGAARSGTVTFKTRVVSADGPAGTTLPFSITINQDAGALPGSCPPGLTNPVTILGSPPPSAHVGYPPPDGQCLATASLGGGDWNAIIPLLSPCFWYSTPNTDWQNVGIYAAHVYLGSDYIGTGWHLYLKVAGSDGGAPDLYYMKTYGATPNGTYTAVLDAALCSPSSYSVFYV